MTIEEEYNAILKSGMFWVWFPNLTGEWEKDAPDFIEYYVTKCKRD